MLSYTDAIEAGSNKSALQQCNKVLKKYPGSDLVKARLCSSLWQQYAYLTRLIGFLLVYTGTEGLSMLPHEQDRGVPSAVR